MAAPHNHHSLASGAFAGRPKPNPSMKEEGVVVTDFRIEGA